MVLINGRKFACEACIRGHRSSSCAHTGRQLMLVRPKGRPSSQCELCRAKRANGSFHGRCDCEGRRDDKKSLAQPNDNSVETFVPYAASASAESQDESSEGVDGGSGKGRHSLKALMNPCRCRTTGVCSCCGGGSKYSASKANETKLSVDTPASCGCNGSDRCCGDGMGLIISSDAQHPERITLTTMGHAQGDAKCCEGAHSAETSSAPEGVPGPSRRATKRKASCCSEKAKTAPATMVTQSPRSLSPEPQPFLDEPMSPDHAAIMDPDCHCGPNCGCPGCMNEGEESRRLRAMGVVRNEECPEKCMTCSACVLGLTRPSGIEAIDKWMEDDKQAQKDAAARQAAGPTPPMQLQDGVISTDTHDESSPAQVDEAAHVEQPGHADRPATLARTQVSRSPAEPLQPVHPALPPFLHAKKFFDQHFMDPERRRYFAGHMQATAPQKVVPVEKAPFGKRMRGESDEEWQARHGFSYLTPEAIEIFDRAKRFREERRLEEERDSAQSTSIASPSPALPVPSSADELTRLRQKALAARRSVTYTPMRG